MRHGLPFVAWAGACLLCCPSAYGDGAILNGVSAHTIGRGGTNIAHTDNGSILHDNPAAMGQIHGETMTQVGITTLLTDFYYADADNNTRGQHQLYGLPEFAYIHKPECSPWSYGFGAFSPAGFGSIYNLNGPVWMPGPQRYKSFGSLAKLLGGAAYNVDDRLSVGGTVGLGVTLADLEGPYTLQGPSGLARTPMLIDLDAQGVAFVWSLGALYELSDRTTVGVAYQSESSFTASGHTYSFVQGLGDTMYDTDVDITWPRSLGVGVRHELCGCQTISADVIWFNWADAFDNFGINLNSPSNPAFPNVYEEFPLDWRDTVSLRLGYERNLGCGRTFRLGYVYHRVPVPASTITPFIPVPLEHGFSSGYGWMCRGWNANFAYMYTFGPTVRVETSDFIGGDFDQSTHRAQTHALGLSFVKCM
jgi:long-subunit fatty acid transport protein